jgi:two-component system, chemotaxis family, chemotaxis protein CheY
MITRRPAHVVIAEDNTVAREVLRGIIKRDEAFTLVGEAVNGHIALELVKGLRPDLVCLDVMMPGLDGLSVMRSINALFPETRVVLVTGQATSEVVNDALAQGAFGLVVKPYSAQKLLGALHIALSKPAKVGTMHALPTGLSNVQHDSPQPSAEHALPAASADGQDDTSRSSAESQ